MDHPMYVQVTELHVKYQVWNDTDKVLFAQ